MGVAVGGIGVRVGGIGVAVGDDTGVAVGGSVGIAVGAGGSVDPDDCPGPQPDNNILMTKTRIAIVCCFVFIVAAASSLQLHNTAWRRMHPDVLPTFEVV